MVDQRPWERALDGGGCIALLAGSIIVLILCAIRYGQLKQERLAQAQQRAVRRQPGRIRAGTILDAMAYPAAVAIGDDEPSLKELWVRQAVKSNPGMTPDAAARLYELWLADQDNPLTSDT